MGDRKEDIERAVAADWRGFFERLGVRFARSKEDEALCFCPLHLDGSPSFSIFLDKETKRRLWRCHGACRKGGDIFAFYAEAHGLDCHADFPLILDEIGAMYGIGNGKPREGRPAGILDYTPSPSCDPSKASRRPAWAKVVATYPYHRAGGTVAYEVARWEWTTNEDGTGERRKDFSVRRPADPDDPPETVFYGWVYSLRPGDRVLYRLHELKDWPQVILTEGEGKAQALLDLGFRATCIFGGSGNWKGHDYAKTLAGKVVLLIPDRDKPGEDFAEDVIGDLLPVAKALKVLDLVEYPFGSKKDIKDWIGERKQGGASPESIKAELVALVKKDACPATLPRRQPEAPAPSEPEIPSEDPSPLPPPDPSPPPPSQNTPLPADATAAPPRASSEEEEILEEIRGALTAPRGGELASRLRVASRIITNRERTLSGQEPLKEEAAEDLLILPGSMDQEFTLEEAAYVQQGSSTGMPQVDFLTFGLRPGWWVVRGASGHGKSTIVNQWVTASAEAGTPWLVIPFEDMRETWRVMMLSRLSSVNSYYISTLQYPTEMIRAQVDYHRGKVAELMAGITWPRTDIGAITLPVIERMVSWWRKVVCLDERGVGGIVIDPIQSIDALNPEEKLWERMDKAIQLCRRWAVQYGIPVITTVHLNMEGKERGSSGFAFSSDVRVLIEEGERAKRYNDGLPDEERNMNPYLDVVFEKNKGMPTGKVICRYKKEHSLWEELSPEQMPPPPEQASAPRARGERNGRRPETSSCKPPFREKRSAREELFESRVETMRGDHE